MEKRREERRERILLSAAFIKLLAAIATFIKTIADLMD
jgi:hypothetical protein